MSEKYDMGLKKFRECFREIGRRQYFVVGLLRDGEKLISDVEILTAMTRTIDFSGDTITWKFLVCEHTFKFLKELKKIKPLEDEVSGIDLSIIYLAPSTGDSMGKMIFKDIEFKGMNLDFPDAGVTQEGGLLLMVGVDLKFSDIDIV